MSRFGYERNKVLFNSANSSTYTSNPQLTVDLATISLSVETVAAAASLFTVQGTNENGFTSALRSAAWSNLTTLTVPGMYTIDAGPRWTRVLRSSIESNATVILQGWAS